MLPSPALSLVARVRIGRLARAPAPRRPMIHRSTDLLSAALRVALAPSHRAPREDDLALIEAASRRAWARLLPDIANHRLGPLLDRAFQRRSLLASLPPGAREELAAAHHGTVLANTILAQFLARLLGDLRERGVEALVVKGPVLESWLYPELGTRPMVDVDIGVVPEAEAQAVAHLSALGFERRAPWAAFVQTSTGIALDLHVLGRAVDAGAIATRTLRVPAVGAVEVRTWEPNAALLELVEHLEKHMSVVGPSLLWVLDIVLLAAREDASLSVESLRARRPRERTLQLLWQVLRLGLDRFGIRPHGDLLEPVAASRALSLPWLLRQRRLQRWGFPRLRFYVRLGARLLRLRPLDGRLWPRALDVPNGWIDTVVDRRTVRGASRTDRLA